MELVRKVVIQGWTPFELVKALSLYNQGKPQNLVDLDWAVVVILKGINNETSNMTYIPK